MNRSIAILLGVLALGAAIFCGSYFAGQRACEMTMAQSADDLSWLRDEFHLSDAEMSHIRELHEGYRPQCMKMCKLVAEKKQELDAALNAGTNVTDEARQKLTELAQLRAQCQAQMLQHFIDVSKAMPPEEGRRYLAEMKKITLGFHEEIEQSMSDSMDHAHGTH